MDISHLSTLKEVENLLDSLETPPTELVISKDMEHAIAGLRLSSYTVGDDIRFRSILCKVKEDYEPKD